MSVSRATRCASRTARRRSAILSAPRRSAAAARSSRSEPRYGAVELIVDVSEQLLRVAQAHDLRVARAARVVLRLVEALPLLQRAHRALEHTSRVVEAAEDVAHRHQLACRRLVVRLLRHGRTSLYPLYPIMG